MAFKMKGAPMHDLSSKHGTNANYKKSGAPGLLDKIVDPLGLKKKLMGGDKNCPPPGQQAPVIGAAKPVEPVTPTTPTPVEQPVVDPNAGVSGQGTPAVPMKKNLKVGAPMKASPAKGILGDKWRDAKSSVKRAGKKAIAAGAGAKAWMGEALGTKEHHMGDGYGRKDPNAAASNAYHKTRNKQKGTGEFGLKEAKQTGKVPKDMSPAARQKQITAMRKRVARDKAVNKNK